MVHTALLSVSVLFGANYVFTKRILATVPPGSWVLFRIAAATLVLVPLALRFGRGRPSLRLCGGLLLASLLGIVGNQLLFTWGMALTTPEHSAVINAGIPTWTLLVAVLAGQERFTGRKLLAIALALGGVGYLLGLDRLIAQGAVPDRDQLLGDLLTLANGWSFAAHLVLMRRIAATADPWVCTAVMFSAATAMTALVCGPGTTAADWQAVSKPPTVWLALYAVLFATVLTYSLNTWALRHTHSSQVALYINVQPLVAAALQLAIGDGVPGVRFLVALLLVASGLWLQTRTR